VFKRVFRLRSNRPIILVCLELDIVVVYCLCLCFVVCDTNCLMFHFIATVTATVTEHSLVTCHALAVYQLPSCSVMPHRLIFGFSFKICKISSQHRQPGYVEHFLKCTMRNNGRCGIACLLSVTWHPHGLYRVHLYVYQKRDFSSLA